MSFVARLVRFVQETVGEPAAPDVGEEGLAAAALLVHVARVDGLIAAGERRALLALLEAGYGLSRGGAEALVAKADRFDLEVDDVGALVEMLGHEGDGLDRARLLGMAYRVAAAEGGIGEFEDGLLWRLGALLRLGEADIRAIRAGAIGDAAPAVRVTA